jgi:D-amino-acid dehydrogenase
MPREVAIVGAGIVGLATAHHLQAEGWRVRLIERGALRRMPGEASGSTSVKASAPALPRLAPSAMPPRSTIVGAGIVGLATAHHLQAEGWRVRLIERGGIAEGQGGSLTQRA